MVAMLCAALGKPWRDPSSGARVYTFPTVEAVAGAAPAALSRSGLGYRSSYLRGFAASVLDGRVSFDEWTRINDTHELRSRIMAIRGIGPYGANNIAMLLSRYDFVPCDSEVCAYLGFPSRTNPKVIQRAIEKRYGRWGKFAFLAFKFERHFRNCNYVDCD
jgi:3-methyladenine DNA glycosylase/8-oxoguanine DNA glycosylase